MDVTAARHDVTLEALCPNKELLYIKIAGVYPDLNNYVFKWFVVDTLGVVLDLSTYVTKSSTEAAFILEWPFILVNNEGYEGYHELYIRSTTDLTERGKLLEGNVYVKKSNTRDFHI